MLSRVITDPARAPARFAKPFTQQEPLPEAAIARAVEVLRSGRLHRYNVIAGETAEVALLEREFAAYQGSRYSLACASGGYALHAALRAAGLRAGEPVLTNAYTLAPVPGAIDNAGGKPVLVEVDADYCIDLNDLAVKAASSGARFLLVSHMRGHIVDMDALMRVCARFGLMLIEDCAHTMGARWDGRRSGSFGRAACFSTQTYKHINSGEGGLLTSDDEALMARAIILSGSYMMYDRHGAAPSEAAFCDIKLDTPNYSGRMDNLRAAILRMQLADLDRQCARWNERYWVLAEGLARVPGIRVPNRSPKESFVGSSIQFALTELDQGLLPACVSGCAERGVEIKWFGEDTPRGFTSRFDSWRYLGEPPDLPRTMAVLRCTMDMRIPLTFDLDDCASVAAIIGEVVTDLRARSCDASRVAA